MPAADRLFIATGEPSDQEMAERIARHQADRGGGWTTLESPLDLAGAITGLQPSDVAVVDCLTLWLSNVMLAERSVDLAASALVEAVRACPAQLFLVSNEVGQGIVPENPLARRFRDEAGRLHQRLAEAADEVVLIVAGLPVRLKPAFGP
jgi:adenosylcobinamide kinase / adenosylcobinamide-phosphate guanylyltransferase